MTGSYQVQYWELMLPYKPWHFDQYTIVGLEHYSVIGSSYL